MEDCLVEVTAINSFPHLKKVISGSSLASLVHCVNNFLAPSYNHNSLRLRCTWAFDTQKQVVYSLIVPICPFVQRLCFWSRTQCILINFHHPNAHISPFSSLESSSAHSYDLNFHKFCPNVVAKYTIIFLPLRNQSQPYILDWWVLSFILSRLRRSSPLNLRRHTLLITFLLFSFCPSLSE